MPIRREGRLEQDKAQIIADSHLGSKPTQGWRFRFQGLHGVLQCA